MAQDGEIVPEVEEDFTVPMTTDRVVKKGCIEARVSGSNFVLVKVDNTCSCPIDLSQPFSAKDARSLSQILFDVATSAGG